MTVKLTNGSEEHGPLVIATMMGLRRLMVDGNGLAVYELRELCRNPSHQLFSNAPDVLESAGLISVADDGKPDVTCLKYIVLAAVVGEGPDMRLVNPVAKGGA